MNILQSSQQELDKIPKEVVYGTMFVHYDSNGAVHLISNVSDSTLRNFEIELNLVKDFLSNKKDFRKFNIEYFYNLSKGITPKEEETVANNTIKTGLYLIPETLGYNNEITVEHDLTNQCWRIIAKDTVLDKLAIIPTMTFFVVMNRDIHFLCDQFTIESSQLKHGAVEVPFTEHSRNLKKIGLATIAKFNSYGIKEIL